MKTRSNFVLSLSVLLVMFILNITLFAQTTVVKGKLLGVNGNSSKYGLVGILLDVNLNGENFVNCDEDGNYSITLTKPGQNFLLYSIPSHSSLKVPVQNDSNKEIKIDIALAPYKYKGNFDNVGVAGTFNDFNISSPEKMTKMDDGTYKFETKTDQKIISYQLCGIEREGRTINNSGSMAYEPDSSGDYKSIMAVKDGKAIIVFEPSKLLVKDTDYKVTIIGSDLDEKIFNLYTEYTSVIKDASKQIQNMLKAQKNMQDFHIDFGSYLHNLLEKIETENDGLVKDYSKLIYVSLSPFRPVDYNIEKAKSFFSSVTPASQAWGLLPNAINSIYTMVPRDQVDSTQDKFLNESHFDAVKLNIYANKLAFAKYSANDPEIKKIRDILINGYSEQTFAKQLLKAYPSEVKIKVGAIIPEFKVTSIDDKSIKYSRETLYGKIYLIDFWATWCMPCVGEMSNLHNVYKKFHKKGFEILSLSMDKGPEEVEKFRNDKWKMPWSNSFINDEKGKKILDEFEVIGIPKPILVDKDGKILAIEGDLRGDNLEKTLAKYLK